MELKLENKCKYCGTNLTYEITGSLPSLTIVTEPCDRCTDNAMREAWTITKKRAREENSDGSDSSEG